MLSKQKPTQQKVLIIDQKNEKKLKEDSVIIHNFAVKMRNGGFKLHRCILAIRDQETIAAMGISISRDRNKLLVEFLFEPGLTAAQQTLKMNDISSFIYKCGHKVIASKLFVNQKDLDSNIAKFVVSL